MRLEALEPRLALAAAPAPSGLVAWWTGDGTAADSAGSNNGILEGGATYAAGVVGQAFSLDGIDDRIRVPNSAVLNPAAGFTVEAWIRPNRNKGPRVIVSKWSDDARDWSYIFKHENAGYSPAFNDGYLRVELSKGFTNDLANLRGQSLFKDGWQHVAFTFDTTTIRLYLNGVLDGSQTINPTALIHASATDFLIGAVTGGGISEFFGGLIDDVKLFNHGLSAEEVWAEFDALAGKAAVVDDSYIAANGNALVVSADGVLANDHGALGAQLVSAPGHGKLELNADGGFIYTPDTGFYGNDTFTYRANGSSDGIATVTIEVARPKPSSLPSGAVSWWRADGDVTDSVGVNDGTLLGAKFAPGKVGHAFDFHGGKDNADDFVQVADSPQWNFGDRDFTINLWVNLRSINPDWSGHLNPLIGQEDGPYSIYGTPFYGGESGWGLFVTGNEANGSIRGAIQLHYHSPGVPWGGVGVACGFSPVLGEWYNLSVTRSGSRFTFYIDGVPFQPNNEDNYFVPKQQGNDGTPLPDVAAPLIIGSTIARGHPDKLNGRIDELAIYNRALSQAEIQSIYDAASAGLVIRVNAEDGAYTEGDFDDRLFPGLGSDPNQSFITMSDEPSLFSVPPAINAAGTLTFTPAPNAKGKTTVTVVKSTSSSSPFEGEEGGDVDTETTTFTIEILQQFPLQNDLLSVNVDNDVDFAVVAWDVLLIINYINSGSPYGVSPVTPPDDPFLDTSGDNYIAPDDVLKVINYINAAGPEQEGESSGSAAPPSLAASSVPSSATAPQLPDEALFLLLATDTAYQPKRRHS